MNVRHQPATLDDVLAGVEAVRQQITESLASQIDVLITALDDLRCEVEWAARNQAKISPTPAPSKEPELESAVEPADEWHDSVKSARSSPDETGDAKASLLTAAKRLSAYEELLLRGRRGRWQDRWIKEDDVEIPTGSVFSVDEEAWNEVVFIRLVHVVGAECHCDQTEGAPFVLVCQTESEFLVRELTEEQATKLQRLCLACQTEMQGAGENAPEPESSAACSTEPAASAGDLPEEEVDLEFSDDEDDPFPDLAAQRLAAFEDSLLKGRRGLWLEEFARDGNYEIRTGLVFSVKAELWQSVLAVRAAHRAGGACRCGDKGGELCLIARQTEREFLLRELTSQEARELADLCLECQLAKKEETPKRRALPSQFQ